MTGQLSHIGPDGKARMVDVSSKAVTRRQAVASVRVTMDPKVLDAVMGNTLPKGDAVATARIAGIMAAKRTDELIPLCHTVPLSHAEVDVDRPAPGTLRIRCTTRTDGRTGVEMEALAGAAVAALTVYDMAKALDRGMTIDGLCLEHKSGGRSGTYDRPPQDPA